MSNLGNFKNWSQAPSSLSFQQTESVWYVSQPLNICCAALKASGTVLTEESMNNLMLIVIIITDWNLAYQLSNWKSDTLSLDLNWKESPRQGWKPISTASRKKREWREKHISRMEMTDYSLFIVTNNHQTWLINPSQSKSDSFPHTLLKANNKWQTHSLENQPVNSNITPVRILFCECQPTPKSAWELNVLTLKYVSELKHFQNVYMRSRFRFVQREWLKTQLLLV